MLPRRGLEGAHDAVATEGGRLNGHDVADDDTAQSQQQRVVARGRPVFTEHKALVFGSPGSTDDPLPRLHLDPEGQNGAQHHRNVASVHVVRRQDRHVVYLPELPVNKTNIPTL